MTLVHSAAEEGGSIPTELEAYPGAFAFMALQLRDSTLETTRVFWRETCFGATEEEAIDPRPWAEVVADRQAGTPFTFTVTRFDL